MKILRLDLLAFGPFTDVSLSPNKGSHGLHLVYGPNEAGKSSSLRALRQLLYGIPHVSSDNFIHSHKNMRIGGLLETSEGNQLEVIRRRGRSKTLRGPDDVEVIDESTLTEILGGVDETMFNQRFGIDYEELRKGGEAVVQGGGDLGEILFAAGAGVADLGHIQQQLDDDASQLFKARGSLQIINKAVSDLAAKRRAIKEKQLHTAEWVKNDKAIKAAEARKEEIEEQLQEKRFNQSRLLRFLKAIPLIDQRKQLLLELAAVEKVPLLPDDFASRRSAATAQLESEQQSKSEALHAIKKLETQIAEIDFPAELLNHRTAINQLHTDLGSFQKATRDRPKLVTQLEHIEQQIEVILKELGREPEIEQADDLLLSRTQRQQIQTLAEECQARIIRQSTAEKNMVKLQEQIQQLESEITELPTIGNIDELKRTIRTIQKQGEIEQLLIEGRFELNELEQQAAVDLKKLRLWDGSLEELEALAVPAIETIERFENDFADAILNETRIEERISRLTDESRELDQALERLRLVHDVPTENDLGQARKIRDEAWQLIRKIWQESLPENDPAVVEFLNSLPDGANLKQAFQSSIENTDSIADRLRREASHVAEKAKLASDRLKKQTQLEELKIELISAQQKREQLQLQWLEQWSDLNISPVPPREMRSWFNQQQGLVDSARSIRKQRLLVEEIQNNIQNCRNELNSSLEELNQTPGREDESLASIIDYCERLVEESEQAIQKHQSQEKSLVKLRESLHEVEQEAVTARSDLEQWRNEWENAVSVLGLQRDSQPSEANSVIESVDDLTNLLKEAAAVKERIQGIDEDNESFKQSVSQLLEQTAIDLAERPVDQAVADLYDRLETASTAQANLSSWKDQLEAEQVKRSKTESKIVQLQKTIKAMCDLAGTDSLGKLPEVEQQSSLRRKIEEEIKSINQRLSDLTAGSSLDQFIDEAEQFDTDQVQADLYRLDDEILQLENERGEIAETIGSLRNELQRMDGSGEAARTQEEAEQLVAAIRSDAEQYVRLRMASVILRRSIERFREASQGPVLNRASELFAELTLGSFAGLRADYDEKGKAVLVGIRDQNKQTVHVENMSDGTCDQMYLAIRLALLESSIHNRNSLPFIVDDILIMFDDARAVAALKVLATLSQKTQVIFFTHHEHLLELARDNIDEKVLFTHTLLGS